MTGAEIGILAAAIGLGTILARVVEKLVAAKLKKDTPPAAQPFNGTPARLERAIDRLADEIDKLSIVSDRLDRHTRDR